MTENLHPNTHSVNNVELEKGFTRETSPLSNGNQIGMNENLQTPRESAKDYGCHHHLHILHHPSALCNYRIQNSEQSSIITRIKKGQRWMPCLQSSFRLYDFNDIRMSSECPCTDDLTRSMHDDLVVAERNNFTVFVACAAARQHGGATASARHLSLIDGWIYLL